MTTQSFDLNDSEALRMFNAYDFCYRVHWLGMLNKDAVLFIYKYAIIINVQIICMNNVCSIVVIRCSIRART